MATKVKACDIRPGMRVPVLGHYRPVSKVTIIYRGEQHNLPGAEVVSSSEEVHLALSNGDVLTAHPADEVMVEV